MTVAGGDTTRSRLRRHVVVGSTAIALAMASAGAALAQSHAFSIKAQSMREALKAFAEQADVQLLYTEKDVAALTSDGIAGAYSREDAIARLLAGSGLEFDFPSANTLVVRPIRSTAQRRPGDQSSNHGSAGGRQLAQVVETPRRERQPGSGMARAPGPGLDEREEEIVLEEMIVTGTQIRGAAPAGSPVFVFDREEVLSSGVSTVQDFIQLLPQNFGGGSNADTALGVPNDINSAFNGGAVGAIGSSVNLRGLGSSSTLVLLNGHRLAPSSGIGDFVDISLIPVSAIERIEVLTDGASSIYGADAVAGVVNFVLRDDFDGVEASIRYGTVTEGSLDEYRASIAGGKSWDGGNALLVYEYFDQGDLSVEDRSFSQDAPLPNDLLPSQERHSILASGSQELTSSLEVSGDFTFSRRESEKDFSDAFDRTFRFSPSSRNLNVSAGGTWRASDTWFVDFSGTYSDVQSEIERSGTLESVRQLDSSIWTGDMKASGAIFNLPGGEVKLAIGSQYRKEEFSSLGMTSGPADRAADRRVYAFFGEALIPVVGASNEIPGITRLELSVSGRFEDFSDFGSSSNPKVGLLWAPFDALKLRGSYGTSFNPPALGLIGASDFIGVNFRTGALGFPPADPSIADVVMLFVQGTGKDLDAENSRAFTAGFDFNERRGQHEFTVSATWFDIEFRNRLGRTPVPDNRSVLDAQNIAFTNPELFPDGVVIFSPTEDQIGDLLDSFDLFLDRGEDPFDAEIINGVSVIRNLARTSVSGFDFQLAYVFDSDIGTISFGLDGAFLADFKQQGTETTPLIELVDTLFNPANLRLRGRASYAGHGIGANIFINYTDDYRVNNTIDSAKIDSWTTVDISLTFDTEEKFGNAVFDNTLLRLSITNLFDKNPPAAMDEPTLGIFGFDPTNASPLNRFISFGLTKRF